MASSTSFIDPSSLAMSSNTPHSPSFDSPSPSPSSPTHDLPSSSSQPPRKRARTEVSSEERKEARAHRNRIAAQNSRDRRKAQFSYLERRVAELEDENRRLRAGIPVSPPTSTPLAMAPPPHLSAVNLPSLASLASVAASAAAGIPMRSPEEELRMRREQERERENEELKERIKTLERGWDAVVKALAAQGLPTGITASSNDSQPTSNNATLSSPSSSKPSPSLTNNAGASTSQTTPSSSTSSPANNLSLSGYAAFPSPAPSHSSLDVNELDISSIPASTPFALQPSIHSQQTSSTGISAGSVSASVSIPSIDKNSTRHLARVATIEPSGLMSLQRSSKAGLGHGAGYLPSPSVTDDDDFGCDEDAKMEDLFREIFVENAASAAKDELSENAGSGLSETAVDAGALWRGSDASEAQVVGAGKMAGEAGQGGEGPQGGNVGESGERQQGEVGVGEKRKREDEEDSVASTSMSDEEMQRMLSEMEVSMMMGDFDPSLVLPVDNFGTLDAGLVGFNDVAPFMEYAAGCQDFGMWAPTNTTVLTGVF